MKFYGNPESGISVSGRRTVDAQVKQLRAADAKKVLRETARRPTALMASSVLRRTANMCATATDDREL